MWMIYTNEPVATHVVHLHGELLKVSSTYNEHDIQDWKDDLNVGDLCENQHQLRPHIVWFGEAVPMMEEAIPIVERSDIIIIVGTSMQVYPAAALIQYASSCSRIYFVDPKPSIGSSERIIGFC